MYNGVKPRFDGKGSVFTNAHRLLPPYCCMTNIDQMINKLNGNLYYSQEKVDELLVEYRCDFIGNKVDFLALIENKFTASQRLKDEIRFINSIEISRPRHTGRGSSLWAQMQLAKKLESRFIIIVGTNGNSPFSIIEFDTTTGEYDNIYMLDFNAENKEEKINECWERIGLRIQFKSAKSFKNRNGNHNGLLPFPGI